MKWAIIKNNLVQNIIVWDGTTQWSIPEGIQVVKLNENESCKIGSSYVEGQSPRFILPSIVYQWTAFQFLNRFTDSELMDIRSKSVSDPIMWKFLTFATAAQEVVSNDPVTVAGMDYLVLTGVLSQTRRNEILGG